MINLNMARKEAINITKNGVTKNPRINETIEQTLFPYSVEFDVYLFNAFCACYNYICCELPNVIGHLKTCNNKNRFEISKQLVLFTQKYSLIGVAL